MNEPARCERCGGPMPAADAVDGRCPRCLLELGLEPVTKPEDLQTSLTISPSADSGPSDASRPAISKIGRYRIVRLIGEGGWARSMKPNRISLDARLP